MNALPGPAPLTSAGAVSDVAPQRTRRAVLAGVGEARNHPSDGDGSTQPVALARTAVEAALDDAGIAPGPGALDLVCSTVGSDDAPDPAGALREEMGLTSAQTLVAGVGVPQQRLVSMAILAVETGAADSVVVFGSEAKASALSARRNDTAAPDTPQGSGAGQLLLPEGEFMAEPEVAAAMWDPVTQYALIDAALARHLGRTPAELAVDVSELWARFDAVASGNPNAEFAGPPRSATELADTTPENRLLAFPYNKWHSTQWALDHAVALVVMSEEAALAGGLDPDRLLHPRVALDSSFGLSLSRREEIHRWPMMRLMGEVASDHLGRDPGEIGATELYSCFPAAVRVQLRELDLPEGSTPTVLGGMAFAGGPFNHFTYMATAELARMLRAGESELALLSTVSGLLTKGGLMVWGREPGDQPALVADVAPLAEAATAARDVAPFDPERDLVADDTVLAATVTGGFDPRVFRIVEDREGTRRVLSRPASSDEDPLDVLSWV